MAKNLYIIATEARSGKSAICLGVMQLLLKDFQRVAFFRPIISGSAQGKKDHDINLILSQFYLNMRYEDAYCYTLDQARDMINQGKHTVMLENILAKYKELEANYDFVLLEGTDFLGGDMAFESDINIEIASNLALPRDSGVQRAGQGAREAHRLHADRHRHLLRKKTSTSSPPSSTA